MKKRSPAYNSLVASLRLAVLAASILALSATARAATSTWNSGASGNWNDSGNWINGVPDGIGSGANFTYDLAANVEITLTSNITLGSLYFDDPVGNSNTFTIISDGTAPTETLTLASSSGTPTIHVATGETSSIGRVSSGSPNTVILAGTQGFIKTGTGRLNLFNSSANNTLTGDVLLQQGSLNLIGNIRGAVIMSASTTLFVAYSGGGTSAWYGLSSTQSTANVAPTSNSRSLTLNGSGNYSYAGTFTGGAAAANTSLIVTMTGGGSQTLTNSGASAQNYNNTTVNSGSLIHTGGGATGTPFGIGNVTLGSATGVGQLKIESSATTGTVAYTGVSTAVGSIFTYNNGAYLSLSKGTAGATGLTYTIGNSGAAANSVLVRTNTAAGTNSQSGTLIIKPGSGLSNLGAATGEKLIVNGGVTTLNGIANPSIIGQDTDGSGSFLNYDGVNGFVLPTYTTGDINGGTAFGNTRVFDATSGGTNTLGADASVYALRNSGQTIGGAFTLSVGTSSGTAGATPGVVIMNGGSIETTNLAFYDTQAGIIYTNGTASISANIINIATGTSGRGVTFEGPGTLTLSGANTFRGGATINETTVSVSANNQLGYFDGTTGPGQINLKGGTLKSTASFTLTSRPITLSPGISSGGGTFDVATGTTLTHTAATSGKIISGTGSLTKKGDGTMILNGSVANTYSGGTIVEAGTLQAGTATGFVNNTAYTVNGGTLDLNDFSLTATTFGGSGGTVDLGSATFTVNQTADQSTTYAGAITGSGSLVNSGEGSLTLTGSNGYTGGTTVSAGTLKSGSSGAFVNNTAYTVNGGRLDLNGNALTASSVSGSGGTISLGAATLTVNQSGDTSYAGTISGSGSVTKSGAGIWSLSSASSYAGGTTISAGTVSVSQNSALGTGEVLLSGTGNTAATQGTLLIGGGNTIANNLTFSGGQAQRTVTASAAYSLGTAGAVSSALGGTNTTSSILEAQTATSQTTITYSFNNISPVAGTNNEIRKSDNFSLTGMESGKMFVLQLSIADTNFADYLAWYDTATNSYLNAVLGNSNAGIVGLSGFQGDMAYNSGLFTLGNWGFDTANNTVWAVLDHNSEFAIAAVPEPATIFLAVGGLGLVFILRRRRCVS